MLLSGKSAKNGGGLLGGESDEDDVEHLDYMIVNVERLDATGDYMNGRCKLGDVQGLGF